MNGSIFFTSFGAIHCVGSKSFTSPAMRVANALASKRVIGPMPLTPPTTFFQAVSMSLPTGDTMPRPVTTTRRLLMLCSTAAAARRIQTAVSRPQKRELRPRAQSRHGKPVRRSGVDVRLDVVDRALHGRDLLGFLVRDLALELFFERHHELDRIERVGAEIIDEGGVRADFVILDAQLFDDDLLDALFNTAHW